mmetsp:Transcript_6080/g.15015  ORF Transcript_6080/g.15015 Transcript_6080/m.15015 type:complete len:212 (+) Transcript_6080:1-636(+)
MNMEHRQVWKNSMYEASSRVPMVISGPNIPKGKVVSTLVSLLDVYPTLLDMVTAPHPSFLQGYSLLPLAMGHRQSRPDYIVSQYHSNMGNTGSFMIRQGPWKYIAFGNTLPAYKNYEPQLFDVDTDPEELKDVAASTPDVASRLDGLLRSVVDYQVVDKEVKLQDAALFHKFMYDGKSQKTVKSEMSKGYIGYDAADNKLLESWLGEVNRL